MLLQEKEKLYKEMKDILARQVCPFIEGHYVYYYCYYCNVWLVSSKQHCCVLWNRIEETEQNSHRLERNTTHDHMLLREQEM